MTKSLEARINELRIECEKFLEARAEELSKGTGVPVVVNLRMLQTTAEGNPFRAALQIIETRKGTQPLQHDNPPDSRPPLGILFLLQPEYADLIPQEYEFSERMREAYLAGTLYCPQTESIQ